MKKLLLIPVAAMAMMFTACGGETKTAEETTAPEETVEAAPVEHPTEFTIRAQGNTMPEMKFDTESITINQGKEITITLINEGDNETMMHNIAIVYNGYAEEVATRGMMNKENGYVAPDDAAVIAASPMSGPGETVSVKFSIEKKGTYQFVCTYPGHWSKMLGTISVE